MTEYEYQKFISLIKLNAVKRVYSNAKNMELFEFTVFIHNLFKTSVDENNEFYVQVGHLALAFYQKTHREIEVIEQINRKPLESKIK